MTKDRLPPRIAEPVLKPNRRRRKWCELLGHHHYRAGEFTCVLCGCTTCEDDL